jgi:hypothetical protein
MVKGCFSPLVVELVDTTSVELVELRSSIHLSTNGHFDKLSVRLSRFSVRFLLASFKKFNAFFSGRCKICNNSIKIQNFCGVSR